MKDVVERFWAKVAKGGSDDCWLWTAAASGVGYGIFSDRSRHWVGAHRFAYELEVGAIPDGLELDHLCRNTLCVNPAHLEPVTHDENMRRGEEALGIGRYATHCKQGHEFTAANTSLRSGRQGRLVRRCRTCHRDQERQRYRQRAAAA